MRPAPGARLDEAGRASRYEIVRLPRGDRPHETLLGLVSASYKPLQNEDAFKFFDPILGKGAACFETAGALGDGERVWALPEPIEVVPGDECHRYLLLSNRHDGQGSATVKFTPIRVVCQNTLMLALGDGQKVYKVRHVGRIQRRL